MENLDYEMTQAQDRLWTIVLLRDGRECWADSGFVTKLGAKRAARRAVRAATKPVRQPTTEAATPPHTPERFKMVVGRL